MFTYEGKIMPTKDGKFFTVILKISHGEPCFDTVKEYEASSLEEASVWVDDELSRLNTGKGIWE